MKTASLRKSPQLRINKGSVKNTQIKGNKRSVSSPLTKSIKRNSKRALRSMLLSPMFHTAFKVLVGVMVSTGLFYGSYIAIGRSFANEVVISKSEIVARVQKLTTLVPIGEEPYDIVRVQDPEDLKKQNAFYKDVEEGDYILMYPNLAVIYNLRSNKIAGIKQVDNIGVVPNQ